MHEILYTVVLVSFSSLATLRIYSAELQKHTRWALTDDEQHNCSGTQTTSLYLYDLITVLLLIWLWNWYQNPINYLATEWNETETVLNLQVKTSMSALFGTHNVNLYEFNQTLEDETHNCFVFFSSQMMDNLLHLMVW